MKGLGACLGLGVLALGLSACSGLSQIQSPVSKFGPATHSVATVESTFLHAVQTADCASQFYSTAYTWATTSGGNFDLSGTCSPSILTDSQVQTRQALMDAISLYADKLTALAAGADEKTFDSSAQDLATKLNTLAKQGGFSDLSIASAVESAIIAISEMALDQVRYADTKDAATKMQQRLQDVVTALKAENTNFATGIDSKIDRVEGELRQIVADARPNRKTLSFFDVVNARRIVSSLNPFGVPPVAATEGLIDPTTKPTNVAQQLNSGLDDVVKANQAIANADSGGVVAAINDLIARAKAAQTTQGALNK